MLARKDFFAMSSNGICGLKGRERVEKLAGFLHRKYPYISIITHLF